MLRVAMCDDEYVYLKKLQDIVHEYFNEKNIEVKVDCYDN